MTIVEFTESNKYLYGIVTKIMQNKCKYGRGFARLENTDVYFKCYRKNIIIWSCFVDTVSLNHLDFKRAMLEFMKYYYNFQIKINEFILFEDVDFNTCLCIENADDEVFIHGERFRII